MEVTVTSDPPEGDMEEVKEFTDLLRSEEAMEKWLKEQEDELIRHRICFKTGLLVSTPHYFAVQRFTSSDVLSMVTTTQVLPTSMKKPKEM